MTRVRLAWALAILSGVAGIADTWLTAASHPLFTEATFARHGWPMVPIAGFGSTVMGATILARYPRNAVGWMLSVSGFTTSTSLATEAYSLWVLRYDGPGPLELAQLSGWVSALFGAQVAFAALSAVFMLAPDSHLPSRRSRLVLYGAGLGLAIHSVGMLTVAPSAVVIDDDGDYSTLSVVLLSVGTLLTAAFLLVSVVSLVRRLRRATGMARQQLRWIAASAVWLGGGAVWLLVVQAVTAGPQTWLASMPLFLGYLAFPIFTAVAVLRHRLYDIDVIINRAVLLTVSTAFVALGYITLVVLVGDNAGGFWPSLLATAVVALAFQPLRSRAVRLADRFAYGPRAVPYEALAEFSRRLGDSPDPSTLLPAVADTAGHAVHARRVVVTLRLPGGADRVATWPAPQTPEASDVGVGIPVLDGAEVLGHIELEMAAGRSLRDHDLTLLRDIADQAAIAFRNARLSAELTAGVEQLRLRTRELAESRRRLITAGDAERRRLERAIARDVVPHLEPLPGLLDELARAYVGGPDPLESLVTASSAALESLREITRGVFPSQLVRGGLGPALRSYLGRAESLGHLELHESAADRRFDPRVEAAAYFCVAEAAQSLETPLSVDVAAPDGQLELHVRGRTRSELALAHIRDRVEAAGGTVAHDARDGLTILDVRLPASRDERLPAVSGDQPAPARAEATT